MVAGRSDIRGNGNEDLDELWKVEDVRRFFGVSKPRAYALMASGSIPTVRIGRSVRVSKHALMQWIAEQSGDSLDGRAA